MVSSSWWLGVLLTPLAAQACAIPIYSYWAIYAKTRNVFDSNEPWAETSSAFIYTQTKSTSIWFMAVAVTVTLLSQNANPCRVFNIGGAGSVYVFAAALLFIMFNSTLRRSQTPKNINSVELINFVIFCGLSVFLLLTASNLLVAFFALELLGSVTLYAFFVFGGYSISGAAQQSLNAVTSCVYQFVLNFFGSVVFYTALTWLAYYHGSNTLSGGTARMAAGWALVAQSATAAALLIKLGTGPWIFYKLSIYKGITTQTVAVYTFIYFGSVLIFTMSLITTAPLLLWLYFGVSCVLVFSLCAVLFGASVFQTGSVTLFLSFSSMLNLIFIVLQIA